MSDSLALPELLIIIAVVACTVVRASLICSKAGYSRWLGALAVIPGINILAGASKPRAHGVSSTNG